MASKNKIHSSAPKDKRQTGFDARAIAANLLGLVVDEGHSLTALLEGASANAAFRALNAKDRAMVRAIVTTSLRHRAAILAVMKKVMDRPEPKRARSLSHLLHIGAAQILFMELPDSAAVNLAVSAIALNPITQRFKGFANAVLRRICREKDDLLTQIVANAPVMSPWLRKQVRRDFGKQNMELIEAMVRHEPYLDMSVKSGQSVQEWAKKLNAHRLATGSLRLTSPIPVQKLEGYQQGDWWVQNAAAAIPVKLFGDVSGKHIADLCAAPGGKSAQLASAGANVTIVDNSKPRLSRVVENFQRLELEGEIVCEDILEWAPTIKFDHVLLDAPCTSTGTMRRHPDVMWSKTSDEVASLSVLQARLLQKAIEMTKLGGTIVFSTCSIAKSEGEDVFARINLENEAVKISPVAPDEVGGLEEIINGQGAIRCLPHHMQFDPPRLGGLDGFFAGRLLKL